MNIYLETINSIFVSESMCASVSMFGYGILLKLK